LPVSEVYSQASNHNALLCDLFDTLKLVGVK